MIDSIPTAPTGAACAHRRVVANPWTNEDGTKSDRWECDLCGTLFVPIAAQAEITALKARVVSVETTWSEACKAEARDCGCWGRIMDLRAKWAWPESGFARDANQGKGSDSCLRSP